MIINCFLLLQGLLDNLKQNTLAKRHPLQIVAFISSIDDYFLFVTDQEYNQHPEQFAELPPDQLRPQF